MNKIDEHLVNYIFSTLEEPEKWDVWGEYSCVDILDKYGKYNFKIRYKNNLWYIKIDNGHEYEIHFSPLFKTYWKFRSLVKNVIKYHKEKRKLLLQLDKINSLPEDAKKNFIREQKLERLLNVES